MSVLKAVRCIKFVVEEGKAYNKYYKSFFLYNNSNNKTFCYLNNFCIQLTKPKLLVCDQKPVFLMQTEQRLTFVLKLPAFSVSLIGRSNCELCSTVVNQKLNLFAK